MFLSHIRTILMLWSMNLLRMFCFNIGIYVRIYSMFSEFADGKSSWSTADISNWKAIVTKSNRAISAAITVKLNLFIIFPVFKKNVILTEKSLKSSQRVIKIKQSMCF